jgi:hypothetical protein
MSCGKIPLGMTLQLLPTEEAGPPIALLTLHHEAHDVSPSRCWLDMTPFQVFVSKFLLANASHSCVETQDLDLLRLIIEY